MGGPDPIAIRRATADDWDEIVALFGRGGASNGCWCQYWLLGPGYHRRDRGANRDALEAQIRADRAGLLATREGRPVGWARRTRRSELGWLTERFASYDFGDDDPRVLSCFFVPARARGAGVMAALIEFAVEEASAAGETLEAYPVDPDVAGATHNRFSGVLPAFLRAGFVESGRLAGDRAVVRLAPPDLPIQRVRPLIPAATPT